LVNPACGWTQLLKQYRTLAPSMFQIRVLPRVSDAKGVIRATKKAVLCTAFLLVNPACGWTKLLKQYRTLSFFIQIIRVLPRVSDAKGVIRAAKKSSTLYCFFNWLILPAAGLNC